MKLPISLAVLLFCACAGAPASGKLGRASASPVADAKEAEESVLATIPFPEGEPAGLLWHAASSTLYIADNENNQVWWWSDAGGLARFATTADPSGALRVENATNVGQIARRSDGTLLIARFGKPGGGYAGLAYLEPGSNASSMVPGLDDSRKRLGVDVTADGRIFGSYFQGMGGSSAVTQVDLHGGETDFATGFKKIVGVLVVDKTLYVSDQRADAIYALPLDGPLPQPGQYRVFASLPRPDQICAGPEGTLFTGQFQAAPGSSDPISVRQIMADGAVRIFASDPDVSRPTGVAYDPAGRRLFVANGGNPAQRFIRVFRVP